MPDEMEAISTQSHSDFGNNTVLLLGGVAVVAVVAYFVYTMYFSSSGTASLGSQSNPYNASSGYQGAGYYIWAANNVNTPVYIGSQTSFMTWSNSFGGGGGSKTGTVTVTITPTMQSTTTVYITGNASTTSSGASISTVSFAWGDGTSISGTLSGGIYNLQTGVQHVYATAGNYTVTVTATDSNGNVGSATASVAITVPSSYLTTPPVISVSPMTVTSQSQAVTVTGSGFTPYGQVFLQDMITSTGATPDGNYINAYASGNISSSFTINLPSSITSGTVRIMATDVTTYNAGKANGTPSANVPILTISISGGGGGSNISWSSFQALNGTLSTQPINAVIATSINPNSDVLWYAIVGTGGVIVLTAYPPAT